MLKEKLQSFLPDDGRLKYTFVNLRRVFETLDEDEKETLRDVLLGYNCYALSVYLNCDTPCVVYKEPSSPEKMNEECQDVWLEFNQDYMAIIPLNLLIPMTYEVHQAAQIHSKIQEGFVLGEAILASSVAINYEEETITNPFYVLPTETESLEEITEALREENSDCQEEIREVEYYLTPEDLIHLTLFEYSKEMEIRWLDSYITEDEEGGLVS